MEKWKEDYIAAQWTIVRSDNGRAYMTDQDIFEHCGPELTAWIQENCIRDHEAYRWYLPVYKP